MECQRELLGHIRTIEADDNTRGNNMIWGKKGKKVGKNGVGSGYARCTQQAERVKSTIFVVLNLSLHKRRRQYTTV
jgi:hypothetical protein